jgi:hypothetical protein
MGRRPWSESCELLHEETLLKVLIPAGMSSGPADQSEDDTCAPVCLIWPTRSDAGNLTEGV